MAALIGRDCGQIGQAPANVFVIGLAASSRTIAYNGAKTYKLLSTLIEACASKAARVGYLE